MSVDDQTASGEAASDADRSSSSGWGNVLVRGLQGMLMGTADVIPGVSGGTMALIVGIYERLIDTIHEVASSIASFARGDRESAADNWRRADFGLVIPLGVGILVALGIGSVVLPPLIERYPLLTSATFFGLIAGALPIPWSRIDRPTSRHLALAAGGAVVAFALAGLVPATVTDPALPLVFGAAAVAICAMILPGVSGAFLLLAMGMYEPTLEAASDLNLAYLGVFAVGAATGLGLFSKLLSWLLDHRHDATMAVLVGLMAGSLRKLWPWQTEDGALQAPPDVGELAIAIGLAAIGLVVVVGLTRIGDRADAAASSSAGDGD